jgi:Subtilase family
MSRRGIASTSGRMRNLLSVVGGLMLAGAILAGTATARTAQSDSATDGKAVAAPATAFTIPLKSGALTSARQSSAQCAATLQTILDSGQTHAAVQFDLPMTDDVRDALSGAGVTLQAYLSANAFFARIDAEAFDPAALDAVPTLVGAHVIDPQWKLHEQLRRNEVGSWMIVYAPADGDDSTHVVAPDEEAELIVAVYVVLHADAPLARTADAIIDAHGAKVRSLLPPVSSMVIELPFGAIRELARRDDVMWIEPPLPRLSTLNDSNRALTGADIVQAAPYNLNGSGVNVLVYDAGTASATHPDLTGRTFVRDTSGGSAHATHVSGTVGGTGAAQGGVFRGMAPGVTIQSYGFEAPLVPGFLYTDPGDILADYTQAMNTHGAVIANNSIGSNTAPNGFPCEWEGNYGVTDTVIDAIARGSASNGVPFRIVWAAGNERQTSRCFVSPPGSPYHTTAPPANAKNHITVGAVNSNDDSITSFTSWGPADDGRLKPDISAPGCQNGGDNGVTSCSFPSGYTTFCGTSMASPTVCGLSALLIEDFRDHYPGDPDPRGSLLKTFWAHNAVDRGNVGPDYQFGYGSVRVQPTIDFVRSGNFADATLSQGGVYRAVLFVPAGATQAKVTIAWDDPPGTPVVSPALVNNLDLKVFNSSNQQYFPWTLDPLNPAAPAVRTVADQVNNIEQVVIDNPLPGAYRIEVHGTNVPQGPQVVSICASPQLVQCSRQGFLVIDRQRYGCSASMALQIVDCDLNTSNSVIDTVQMLVTSTSEPAGEVITLTETAAETASFVSNLPLSTSNAAGVLLVAAGDSITATYIDADDGLGGINVPVIKNATVDCQLPIINGLNVSFTDAHTAVVQFTTSEDCVATVRYGGTCATLTNTEAPTGYRQNHSIVLDGLVQNTLHFFTVQVDDLAANITLSDNGGACHQFTTPRLPDLYTENFTTADFDLDNSSLLFVQNGSIDYYALCRSATTALPTDPTGGTPLVLSDDSNLQVTLNGASVQLYGVSYNTFWVGSNGYITFTAGDSERTPTPLNHFDLPRVSGFFANLDPMEAGGSVSWKREADRVAVTWLNVARNSLGDQNTFQIEMFFDGRIRMTWLDLPATTGLVGLSRGAGLSPDFFEANFSAAIDCGPRPPSAAAGSAQATTSRPEPIRLLASDDGTPGPLTYVITQLPAQSIRDSANDHLIVPADLPYTLINGGNTVLYLAANGYAGPDSFQFRVNDGGSPPTGGDSNVATVGVTIVPLLQVPFIDEFLTTTVDPAKWYVIAGAISSAGAADEPSPPNSLELDNDPTGGNRVESHLIDLAGVTQMRLSYWWVKGGGLDGPNVGEDLWVEYQNADGIWIELRRYLGSLPDGTSWNYEAIELPAGALHGSFKVRFRNLATGADGGDNWFIDNIQVQTPEAPVSQNATYDLPFNALRTITLVSTDPNNDPLTYQILSLPTLGDLSDPATGVITSVPHVLSGDSVIYNADSAVFGADLFTFRTSDGPNFSNTARININLGGLERAVSFNLSSDPGWSRQGDWQYGVPQGLGSPPGDPTSGFTGANVFGYNLAGDYPNNLFTTHYLTTSAINCTNLQDTELRFRRWLGVDQFGGFDRVNLQASINGTSWTTLWAVGNSETIRESAWSLQTYNLAALADDRPTVFLRWGLGGTSNGTTSYGWNIDDIEIWGRVPSIRGDLNRDCDVDLNDLATLLTNFGLPSGATLALGDVDGDADVDLTDLALMIQVFGTTCP